MLRPQQHDSFSSPREPSAFRDFLEPMLLLLTNIATLAATQESLNDCMVAGCPPSVLAGIGCIVDGEPASSSCQALVCGGKAVANFANLHSHSRLCSSLLFSQCYLCHEYVYDYHSFGTS